MLEYSNDNFPNQESEAKPLPSWPHQSPGGLGMGMNQFENRFGGGGMFQPPPFPPQRSLDGMGAGGVASHGANNPNVIVVDTNQLTTR